MQDVYKRFGKEAEFIGVYIHEAHATDSSWPIEKNTQLGIVVPEPRTFQERESVARKCCESMKMPFPILVDEIDDRVGRSYCAMPDRLYVIDSKGRVAYKAGIGPFGYNPSEMEQALIMLLLEEKKTPIAVNGAKAAP